MLESKSRQKAIARCVRLLMRHEELSLFRRAMLLMSQSDVRFARAWCKVLERRGEESPDSLLETMNRAVGNSVTRCAVILMALDPMVAADMEMRLVSGLVEAREKEAATALCYDTALQGLGKLDLRHPLDDFDLMVLGSLKLSRLDTRSGAADTIAGLRFDMRALSHGDRDSVNVPRIVQGMEDCFETRADYQESVLA